MLAPGSLCFHFCLTGMILPLQLAEFQPPHQFCGCLKDCFKKNLRPSNCMKRDRLSKGKPRGHRWSTVARKGSAPLVFLHLWERLMLYKECFINAFCVPHLCSSWPWYLDVTQTVLKYNPQPYSIPWRLKHHHKTVTEAQLPLHLVTKRHSLSVLLQQDPVVL